MTTIKTQYVHDLSEGTMYPITGTYTWKNVVGQYVGTPYEGEKFNVVEDTRKGFMAPTVVGNSEVLRSYNKTYVVLESWQWTGRAWKRIGPKHPRR